MAITIRSTAIFENTEKVLSEIFENKTMGAETVLNSFNHLYLNTLQELIGVFTKGELVGLMDLRNGTMFDPQFACNSKFLLAELEDAEKFDEQSKRFGFDYKKLKKKIEELTSAQVYILLVEINRFWMKESQKENSLNDFTIPLIKKIDKEKK